MNFRMLAGLLFSVVLVAGSGCQTNHGNMGGDLKPIVSSVPPNDVMAVMDRVMKGIGRDQNVSARDIAPADLAVLERYAGYCIGKARCPIQSIDGCGSCCNDNYRANLVHTDCGLECWTCGGFNECGR